MAARKDFASKNRSAQRQSRKTASPRTASSKPAEKSVEPSPAPPAKKRPLKLIIASLIGIGVITLVLQQLISVDPREIRESGISALIEEKTSGGDTANIDLPVAAPPVAEPTSSVADTVAKKKAIVVAATPKTATVVKKVPVTDISSVAEQKEPFQFYKILAENSVETEVIAAYKSTPKTANLKKKTLLQTGSFRLKKDADRMKARLLLNNFPAVKVTKTTSERGTWYRVRTGPFITFNKLKSALIKLNKLNITPMQIPVG